MLSDYIFEVEKKLNSEKADKKTSYKAAPVWRGPRSAPSQVDQARKKKNKHGREGGDQSNKQGKKGRDQSNKQGKEGRDQLNSQGKDGGDQSNKQGKEGGDQSIKKVKVFGKNNNYNVFGTFQNISQF